MSESTSTPTQIPDLDAILARAGELWREYGAHHPTLSDEEFSRLSTAERRAQEAEFFEAFTGVYRQVIPTDRWSLLALAADERVWSLDCSEHGYTAKSVPDAVTTAVQIMIDEINNAYDDAQLAVVVAS